MALAEHPRQSDVSTIVKSFADVLNGATVRDVEVVVAFLALLMADRIEQGDIEPSEADRLFTLIDVQLTDRRGSEVFSDEAQELLIEAHHLHHLGGWAGADLDTIRDLARAILSTHASCQEAER